MTISSATNKSGPYTENGVTDTFAYEFKIEDETHVKVVRAASGVETVLTLTTDYTVTGVGDDAGGNVVINTPVSGSTLTLVLDVPFVQELDLENQGAYFAESVEAALDLAVQRDKQLQEQIDRAVVVPVSADVTDLDTLVAGILTLEPIAPDITTVAGIAGNVTTVAGISANVTTVAGISANVTTVAGISADVTAVAADAADIGTVAGAIANVNTVAGIAANVTAVAANSSNINAVATNIASVNSAASNMAAIIAAPTEAANAAISADEAAASAASILLPAVPVALTYLRRDAANTRYEERTPNQAAEDLATVRFNGNQTTPLTQAQRGQHAKNSGQLWERIGEPVKLLTNATTIDFTGLDDFYALRLLFRGATTVADVNLLMHMGFNAYDTNAANYVYQSMTGSGTGTTASTGSAAIVSVSAGGGNLSTHAAEFDALIMGFNVALHTMCDSNSNSRVSGGTRSATKIGLTHAVAQVNNRLQIALASGQFLAGSFAALEGIRA